MVIKIFLFFLFLSIVLVHASNECLTANCEKYGPFIQFPFWLQGTQQQQQQQQNCTPFGFNLSCNGQKYPILHIPGSGDFYLKSVYYSLRSIILQDVEGCLPKRLLTLNLSSTPFMAVMYRNYTYFSCSKGQVDSSNVMECASNATSDVFATNNVADGLKFSECSKIATVPVPDTYFDYGFPVFLELTWGVRDPETDKTPPYCQNCRSTTGRKDKLSESIAVIVVIPILFLLIMIVVFVCMKKQGSHNNNSRSSSSSSIQISEDGGRTSRGLDKSTIEAYKKITIGESPVEGPNGVTCTICLTDYVTNDTIRFMPICEHYFHVECIDKWLSLSRKCPVCRISLPSAISC